MSPRFWFTTLLLAVAFASSAPAAAQPLISSPVNGTRGIDSGAALTLAWTSVPKAEAYTVEMSENSSFSPLMPLANAQVKAIPGALGQTYTVAFSDETTLNPGRTYHWRVTATTEGGSTTSSQAATFSTVADPFAAIADHGFSLTRAEDGVNKDKPAAVGFIREGGPAPSQQVFAEFLFGWEGPETFVPRTGPLSIGPALSYAGKMSSAKNNEDTLAKLAGGIIADIGFDRHSLYQTLDLTYEGDQQFDDAEFTFDYLLTYSGPLIGRFLPIAATAPAQVLVRPYFLAVVADKEAVSGDRKTRVGTQLDLKLRLNVISRALGISQTLVSVTDRYLWLEGYNRERANYLTAALDFSIAKGLSLGYLYKHGHDAPAFKGVTRQALTIGVGFGS